MQHHRIDKEHGNAYTAWQALGSPQQVSPVQQLALAQAGQLALLTSPARLRVQGGQTVLRFPLPRQGVSLLRLSW